MNRKKLQFLLPILALIIFLSSPLLMESKVFFHQDTSAHADISNTPTQTVSQKTLTYRGSAQASGIFNGNGVSVILPSNIQSGDLLIAVAGTNGSVTSWSTTDGWTQGENSNATGAQGLTWWWKVADGSESGSPVTFQSNRYADGGVVVNVYQGQTDNPIAGVSALTTSDNFGNGFVNSATVAGVSLDKSVTAVPLIFASWQPNNTRITWPDGFIFESAANDGYSFVAAAESLSSLTTNNFPGFNLPIAPAEAVVQTLQVLVKVQ